MHQMVMLMHNPRKMRSSAREMHCDSIRSERIPTTAKPLRPLRKLSGRGMVMDAKRQ
jgi:hypothetical protein